MIETTVKEALDAIPSVRDQLNRTDLPMSVALNLADLAQHLNTLAERHNDREKGLRSRYLEGKDSDGETAQYKKESDAILAEHISFPHIEPIPLDDLVTEESSPNGMALFTMAPFLDVETGPVEIHFKDRVIAPVESEPEPIPGPLPILEHTGPQEVLLEKDDDGE